MSGLARLNKVYLVKYYDKYNNVHSCAYAREDNAKARYNLELARSRHVILTVKKRRMVGK